MGFAGPLKSSSLLLTHTQIRNTLPHSQSTSTNCSAEHVKALCRLGLLKEAFEIVRTNDHTPSYALFDTLLDGCLRSRSLAEGKIVHAHMIQRAFKFHAIISLSNKLVSLYAKFNLLEASRRVLEEMPRKNTVTWTVIIAAYARQKRAKEALELYGVMKKQGVGVNQFTFPSVLAACGDLGDPERGREVHGEVIEGGFEGDLVVGNALVDMYGKCGSVEQARQVFDKMPQRNAVSWNSMMAGMVFSTDFSALCAVLFQDLKLLLLVCRLGEGFGSLDVKRGDTEDLCKVFDKMPR